MLEKIIAKLFPRGIFCDGASTWATGLSRRMSFRRNISTTA